MANDRRPAPYASRGCIGVVLSDSRVPSMKSLTVWRAPSQSEHTECRPPSTLPGYGELDFTWRISSSLHSLRYQLHCTEPKLVSMILFPDFSPDEPCVPMYVYIYINRSMVLLSSTPLPEHLRARAPPKCPFSIAMYPSLYFLHRSFYLHQFYPK